MSKKFTPYIYILFLVYFSEGILGQQFTLKIKGKDSIQTSILNTISYKNKHVTEKDLFEEVFTFHEKVKRKGYFTSTYSVDSESSKNYVATFLLGQKIEELIVIIPSNLKNSSITKGFPNQDSVKIKTESLQVFTDNIIKELDKLGKSFSNISFKNLNLTDDTLYIHLKINLSKKRSIDNVVIRGYDQFPKSYLKNFFQISKKTIFSKQELTKISKLTKTLSFAEEKKEPEVLFKKDSTILYLFLNKLKKNSIDGIINFASKENGDGILLNGNIDLELNNILNTGERFRLFWNRIGDERSEFELRSRLPYLFNSSISTEIAFNIYRQDSTFLNTKFAFELDYQLSSKSKVSASYTTENSNNLLSENQSSNLVSFSNYFAGIGFRLNLPGESNLYNNKLEIDVKSGFGNRNIQSIRTKQIKLELTSTFRVGFSSRSYFFIKNETGFLDSKNLLLNELYRIGGANSIRGFNEQSIFTSEYSYFNIEYRITTSQFSYLHSITDVGFYKNSTNRKINRILGIGLGYSFKLNSNLINLGYALGINSDSSLGFDNSKLIIKWTSFF